MYECESWTIKKAAAAAAAKSLQSSSTLQPHRRQPTRLGFSRQEHWSGLPFPSPVHESEKWKLSRSVVSDSSQPHGLQPTRLLHPRDFPGKSTKELYPRVPKNWCFQIVVLEKTLESSLDCRRSNQTILKKINTEYSLEGLMPQLKFQYFDCLM